jgi:pimeloyl-ACP methyl ester carboxylesterase
MSSRFIKTTDGMKIAFQVFGKGDPIVLVHGMGSNKEMWKDRKWVERLEKYFTVITLDLRGHGESDKSYDPSFYTSDNIINDVEEVVKACGFKEYNYFGHSYGATIGLQLCKYSNNIKQAVCAGTTFGDEFFKNTVPEWLIEYESLNLNKRNNTLKSIDLSDEDIDCIEKTDLDLILAQLKAWQLWEGVDIKDIKAKLAVYSGTKDNPSVIQNLLSYENDLLEHKIAVKLFDNLNHTQLVSEIEQVSPWVIDFFLKY